MEPLPTIEEETAPSCALDEGGLHRQLERYRRAGAGAELLERSTRHFVVRLRADVNSREVSEAVSIERECCPFYEIGWDPASRELSFGVQQDEHQPALGALLAALGLAD